MGDGAPAHGDISIKIDDAHQDHDQAPRQR
jgi:hypothetical protein